MKPKPVLLMGTDCPATNALYHALDREFGVQKVILENRVPRFTFLKNRAKKLGITKVIGQIGFQTTIVPTLRMISGRRIEEIIRNNNIDTSAIDAERVIRVQSVNSERTQMLLKELNPQVVVLSGTRIVSEKTLAAVPRHFLNLHTGITPLFRGVHGGYWALATDQPALCGVTVHLVDAGIDSGGVLGQSLIHPTHSDNFYTYPYLQLAQGTPLMISAVRNVLNNTVNIQAPLTQRSELWSHPTLFEYLSNLLRRHVR